MQSRWVIQENWMNPSHVHRLCRSIFTWGVLVAYKFSWTPLPHVFIRKVAAQESRKRKKELMQTLEERCVLRKTCRSFFFFSYWEFVLVHRVTDYDHENMYLKKRVEALETKNKWVYPGSTCVRATQLCSCRVRELHACTAHTAMYLCH